MFAKLPFGGELRVQGKKKTCEPRNIKENEIPDVCSMSCSPRKVAALAVPRSADPPIVEY